jgi:hypothetical protein
MEKLMDKTRWIKTEQQFKKNSIVEITEPNGLLKKSTKKTYRVIMSSDILNRDEDGYYVTIFEEISKQDSE